MIPNLNPKQLEQAMKKLGVKQQKIDAYEVIIKTNSGNLIIKNPDIIKINMMGNESLQITGEITEEQEISEEDITTVITQTGVTKEKAKQTLEKVNGDLAEAIMHLKKD
jgi:nascent polypeptide-associated complex subunit alpha